MHILFKNRYVLLFAAVLLFIVIPPFVPSNFFGGIIITILLSVVTIQSVYLLVEKEKNLKYGFAIGFAVIAIIWITHFLETPNADNEISNILLFLYFSYILFILITHMLRSRQVNLNMILMAITIYLLMAVEGGFVFAVLNQFLTMLSIFPVMLHSASWIISTIVLLPSPPWVMEMSCR